MRNPYNLEMIHLDIGKIVITESPIVVRTILGSCVSVVMFVPSTKLAMISHSIYPGVGKEGNLHYTVNSIERMDKEIRKNGIPLRKVIVKIFGGGQQLIHPEEEITPEVQSNTVQSAVNELKRRGYTINTGNVGGYCSRSILFNTATGEVLLKRSSTKSQKDLRSKK